MLERRPLGDVQGPKWKDAYMRKDFRISRGTESAGELNIQVVLGHQEEG